VATFWQARLAPITEVNIARKARNHRPTAANPTC
jgi:hypothetical protein